MDPIEAILSLHHAPADPEPVGADLELEYPDPAAEPEPYTG